MSIYHQGEAYHRLETVDGWTVYVAQPSGRVVWMESPGRRPGVDWAWLNSAGLEVAPREEGSGTIPRSVLLAACRMHAEQHADLSLAEQAVLVGAHRAAVGWTVYVLSPARKRLARLSPATTMVMLRGPSGYLATQLGYAGLQHSSTPIPHAVLHEAMRLYDEQTADGGAA